jgi:hypothetical protein
VALVIISTAVARCVTAEGQFHRYSLCWPGAALLRSTAVHLVERMVILSLLCSEVWLRFGAAHDAGFAGLVDSGWQYLQLRQVRCDRPPIGAE